jgi:hypothetical protein
LRPPIRYESREHRSAVSPSKSRAPLVVPAELDVALATVARPLTDAGLAELQSMAGNAAAIAAADRRTPRVQATIRDAPVPGRPTHPRGESLASALATRVPAADVGREIAADRAADAALAGPALSGERGAEAVRRNVEQATGEDLSGVRIATDSSASRLANILGARAFALGELIAFAHGEFAPTTAAGQRLLAHELAHVAQQRRAGRATIDRQPASTKSLDDRVLDFVIKLNALPGAVEASHLMKARALWNEATAALLAVKASVPAPADDALEAARKPLQRLAVVLIDHQQADAAIDLALVTGDPVVTSTIVRNIRGWNSGVAGQQWLTSRLARLAGEMLSPADETHSKEWLERNTEAIGRSFKALEAQDVTSGQDKPLSLVLLEDLLKEYFVQAKANVDTDPAGRLTNRTPPLATEKDTNKIEIDCDIYATYGVRALRAAGWQTVGYLVLVPDPSLHKDAHATALAKRPVPNTQAFSYVGVNSYQVRELWQGTLDSGGLFGLLWLTLAAYENDKPAAWKAWYLPAGPDGRVDMRLFDAENAGLTPTFEVRSP